MFAGPRVLGGPGDVEAVQIRHERIIKHIGKLFQGNTGTLSPFDGAVVQVRHIHDVGHTVPFVGHITADQIGKKQAPALHEINDLAEGGTARIKGDMVVFNGNKIFFFAGHGVVYAKP